MSTPFTKLPEDDFDRHDEAQQLRARFKVIRSVVTGDETTTDDDRKSAELAEVLALGTDAANFVIADLAACPGGRAFVDAVMGVTAGGEEFVFATDEQLAARMGVKSTKTVQTYRKQFMAVKNYSAIIEIKRNYRDAVTLESFPHQYKCKLTALAVEAMQNAQLSPGWSGDPEHKMKAMREAAETVARGASFGRLTPPSKRRKPTDGEVVDSKLRAAAAALEDAAKRRPMVRNPDFERLSELRQKLVAALAEFDQAYDFAPATSIQIQEEEGGNAQASPPPVSSDDPSLSPRMDESETFTAMPEKPGAEVPQVVNFSTWNDSIESTVYENGEIPPMVEKPPPDDSLNGIYLRERQQVFDEEIANGATEAAARTAARSVSFEEWRRPHADSWERMCAGLKGGKRDE